MDILRDATFDELWSAKLRLVFLVEVLFDGRELTAFELGDLDRVPPLGGSDQCTEHQLQDGEGALFLSFNFNVQKYNINKFITDERA